MPTHLGKYECDSKYLVDTFAKPNKYLKEKARKGCLVPSNHPFVVLIQGWFSSVYIDCIGAVLFLILISNIRSLLWIFTRIEPGPWFNIKMSSYQFKNSHCGDKTILYLSYLRYGISYTGKTPSFYGISPQWPLLLTGFNFNPSMDK